MNPSDFPPYTLPNLSAPAGSNAIKTAYSIKYIILLNQKTSYKTTKPRKKQKQIYNFLFFRSSPSIYFFDFKHKLNVKKCV